MKKLTALILLLALAVSLLSGCGEKAPKSMTFKEFDEKWRRADFDKFLVDPSEFIGDLKAVNTFGNRCGKDDVPLDDSWEISYEFETYKAAEKECVLFNRPFSYSIDTSGKDDKYYFYLSVRFETGDISGDLALLNSLYSNLVGKYGDPVEIKIDDHTVDEPKLLRILNGSDNPESMFVSFESASLSLFAFKHTDGHYSSSVTIHAYPDIPDEE